MAYKLRSCTISSVSHGLTICPKERGKTLWSGCFHPPPRFRPTHRPALWLHDRPSSSPDTGFEKGVRFTLPPLFPKEWWEVRAEDAPTPLMFLGEDSRTISSHPAFGPGPPTV